MAHLQLPVEYIHDAAHHINNAKHRVSLLSMVVADDDVTNDVITALCSAAERGVVVEVAADIFTYGELGGFFMPSRYRTRQSRSTTQLSRRLKKSGVKFTWLGRSKATIFSGRTHIKWCVVDDTVYSFGGVNLYEKGVSHTDYMFKVNDARLADRLVKEYRRLKLADARDRAYRSISFKHDIGTVLIDGGFFGDSIIYRRACALTSRASSVTLVSQYGPTGKLSKLLKKTDAKLYFNPPSLTDGLNRLVIRFGMFFSGQLTHYTKPHYLHAKFMLFEMPDGRTIALTGSHNFVHGGVLLGTREIALQTENPAVIKQLRGFLANNIA